MIAAAQSNKRPTSHVMIVAKFERFFRIAAGLDVDKQDLKRHSDFINRELYDLLVRAEAVAKANGRVTIEPFDLPIAKGLQQSIDEFENIDEEIELRPILEHLAGQPPLELAYGEDIEDQLPVVVGGLSVALARAFKIIDGDLKIPATRHWQLPHFRSADVGRHSKSLGDQIVAFVVEPGGCDDQRCDGLAGWRCFRRHSPGGGRRYFQTAPT